MSKLAEDDESRRRFTGTEEDLGKRLLKIAKAKGRMWCKYDESKTVMETKTDADQIRFNHDLLEELKDLNGGLLFKKTQMRGGIKYMLDSMSKVWNYTPKNCSDMTDVMDFGVRNLCHVVTKGEQLYTKNKRKGPAWVSLLPWIAREEEKDGTERPNDDDEDAGAPAATKTTTTPKHTFGFDREMLLGFRVDRGSTAKTMSMPINTDDMEDNAPLMVDFWDEQQITLDDITVGEFRELQKGRRTEPSCAWQGEHHVTHNKVSLCQRVDRSLLLSIYEQTRQIEQIRVSAFGPLLGEQSCVVADDDATLKLAYDFLQPLALRYCNGDIADVQALKQEKKRLLSTMTLLPPIEAARKPRPPTTKKKPAKKTKGKKTKQTPIKMLKKLSRAGGGPCKRQKLAAGKVKKEVNEETEVAKTEVAETEVAEKSDTEVAKTEVAETEVATAKGKAKAKTASAKKRQLPDIEDGFGEDLEFVAKMAAAHSADILVGSGTPRV
jgi:hypothetical protein